MAQGITNINPDSIPDNKDLVPHVYVVAPFGPRKLRGKWVGKLFVTRHSRLAKYKAHAGSRLVGMVSSTPHS